VEGFTWTFWVKVLRHMHVKGTGRLQARPSNGDETRQAVKRNLMDHVG